MASLPLNLQISNDRKLYKADGGKMIFKNICEVSTVIGSQNVSYRQLSVHMTECEVSIAIDSQNVSYR